MVTFHLGGVDVSLKVFVPAVNSFFMGFQAEGVQFPLVYTTERDIPLTKWTEFGFFGEQVVAKVILYFQKVNHLLRQENGLLMCFMLMCFLFMFILFMYFLHLRFVLGDAR